MVLLTSSAVSAAFSAGIVCTFTFLLFLSGYVLQQQTVKSLQEAIRNPPEKPWYPKPTLPPQFLKDTETIVLSEVIEDKTEAFNGQNNLASTNQRKFVQTKSTSNNQEQDEGEPSPKQLWYEYVKEFRPQQEPNDTTETVAVADEESSSDEQLHGAHGRHAYILSIPNTTDLCSVVFFTEWHRLISKISPQPNIVYIYPASWEMSDSPIHTGAMNLIRKMQDKHGIICHPVSISRIWAGVSVESQLLAELQRTRWTYDRAMFFRSPGIALDIAEMDRALTTSSTRTSWQRLSSKSSSLTPSLLLYVPERGLLAPMADMRKLTTYARSRHTPHHGDEMAGESKHAAYVIFDDKDLQHRRTERIPYPGIFERFERERRNACADTAILSRFDENDIP